METTSPPAAGNAHAGADHPSQGCGICEWLRQRRRALTTNGRAWLGAGGSLGTTNESGVTVGPDLLIGSRFFSTLFARHVRPNDGPARERRAPLGLGDQTP